MGDTVNEQLPDVDSNTLAKLLGVSGKTIYDLAKTGVLVRASGRMFVLEASVQRYCSYLRGHAAQAAE